MEKCIYHLTFKGDRRTAYRRICDASAGLVQHVLRCRHCIKQLESITLNEIARMRAEFGQCTDEEFMFEKYRRALERGSENMILQAKIEAYLLFRRTTLTEPVPVN